MSVTGLVTDAAPDMVAPKRKSERCETCRFWKRIDDPLGNCRASPPSVLASAMPDTVKDELDEQAVYDATRFPMTHEEEWCGEFEWLSHLEPVTGC